MTDTVNLPQSHSVKSSLPEAANSIDDHLLKSSSKGKTEVKQLALKIKLTTPRNILGWKVQSS